MTYNVVKGRLHYSMFGKLYILSLANISEKVYYFAEHFTCNMITLLLSYMS